MKRAAVTPICLSLCLAWSAGSSSADDRALLIGIGKYQVAEANLPGVGEDLEMMREVVRTLGFADSQVRVLADSQATLQGIRDAISDWLVEGTTAGDRAFFYHSGHGTRTPDLNGDENDGSDEVLLPFDFREIPTGGGETQLRNVLLDDELGRLLAAVPAREVVVLIDSCHSGTMTRSLGGRWTSKFYSYPGIPRGLKSSIADRTLERRDAVVLLSAAGPDEEAQTSERGALFTQGIWKAVREAAPRQQLTLGQLRSATESYIRQEVGGRRHLVHRPMLTGGAALRSINLFLPPGKIAGGEPGVEIPSDPNRLWQDLETLVREAARPLEVVASKAAYRTGESLELSVVAPSDGYLHILNVGDGEDEMVVLYPNPYQTDNRVTGGQTVRIPSFDLSSGQGFTLPARLPADRIRQKNLVVAIQTPRPLFAGDRAPADPGELFRVIRYGELTRSISREPLARHAYSAGQVVVTIGL